MTQTPVHDSHNPDLLKLMPPNAKRVIEVGCSSGALAREFKKLNPSSLYFGVEIESSYAQLAQRHCDETLVLNIENADDSFWSAHADKDCWVFGDALEHLVNPWLVLKNVYQCLPLGGVVVACIPNAQHWSVQARLSIGDFRYENEGLLDRTHIRWFTRQTIVEMFHGAGFEIQEGAPRIFDEPSREHFLPIIGEMAKAAGADPDIAISDAIPLQYVIRAVKNK
jgi:SAM-dependent methyltransferase